MTEPEPRCDWSDLPVSQCAHCQGDRPDQERGPKPTRITEDEVRILVTTERLVRGILHVAHPVAYQEPTSIRGAVAIDTTMLADLTDYVTDLCTATIRRQEFSVAHINGDGTTTYVQERHQTTSPSLLEQLWSAVEASGSVEGGARSFASKPSARLDAIDAAQRIDTGAFTWLRKLGHVDVYDDPEIPDTAAAVRRLGSLVPSLEKCTRSRPAHDQVCCTQHHVETDIKAWWVSARVLTGWDSPAWKPDNTCPLCETRGSLRVKLEHQTAVCVECGETWTQERIGLLAEHIRAENHEDDQADVG